MAQTVFFLILFLFFLTSSPVYAARSISITTEDTTLFGDEEAKITVSPSGFSDGETVYIKGAFYQDGSTNYFGYTKKEDSWVKNGVSTVNQNSQVIGQWNNKLQVKSDFSDSGYHGEGDYLFKVGFYYTTSGGNLSSVNWSTNSISFTINEPDPSPSPSPSPTNQKSPSLSPAIVQVTKVIQSPSPAMSMLPSPSSLILGESTQSATSSASPSNFESPPVVIKKPQKNNSKLPDVLISGGLILSGFSLGAYLWYKHLQH